MPDELTRFRPRSLGRLGSGGADRGLILEWKLHVAGSLQRTVVSEIAAT